MVHCALVSQKWDVVVMQQGPSTLVENQLDLARWAGRFADEARAHGMRPAVLCIWPDGGTNYGFRSVISSYRLAAQSARATFLPAGVAWWAVLKRTRRAPLYGPDDFHPAPLGTYLAAAAVYRGLGLKPARLPRSIVVGGAQLRLTEARIRSFELALAEALPSPRRAWRDHTPTTRGHPAKPS